MSWEREKRIMVVYGCDCEILYKFKYSKSNVFKCERDKPSVNYFGNLDIKCHALTKLTNKLIVLFLYV